MTWDVDMQEFKELQRENRQLQETVEFLVEVYRIPREHHDPQEWHGGMAENIAACPTCRVNAVLPRPRAN